MAAWMAKCRCVAIGFLILVVFAQGCAGTKQRIEREGSRADVPDWVSQTPQSDQYLYFVGSAVQASSIEEGRKQAHSSALNEASAFIGVKINSETHLHVSSDLPSPSFGDRIDAYTAAQIAGMEIIDEDFIKIKKQTGRLYEEQYDVYLLGRFPKDAADQERLRQKTVAGQTADAALQTYLEAKEDEKAGRLADGLLKIREAIRSLGGIDDHTRINDDRMKTCQQLMTALVLTRNALQEKSRSLFLEVTIKMDHGSLDAGAFEAALSNQVTEYQLHFAENAADSRFRLQGRIGVRKGGIVFGQQCIHASYELKVKDIWTDKYVAGESSVEKGFSASVDGAVQNALNEAGMAAGRVLGARINQYLQKAAESRE